MCQTKDQISSDHEQNDNVWSEEVATHHSGLVTTLSITVPGGGLFRLGPPRAKNLELILFFTTTTPTRGLKTFKHAYILTDKQPLQTVHCSWYLITY